MTAGWRAALVALLVALGGAAAADGRALDGAEAAAFRAVGRLDIAGVGYCTATLISDRLVVTAAHCLYHPRTGVRRPPSALRFRTGLGAGESVTERRVLRAVEAPGFSYTGRPRLQTLGADLALLELTRPVDGGAAAPLVVAPAPGRDARLIIVSYAGGRGQGQGPSIHESCPLRGEMEAVVMLGCAVVFGGSGGPVLAGEGDERRLVGVVSANWRIRAGRAMTLVVMIEPVLDALMSALEGGG